MIAKLFSCAAILGALFLTSCGGPKVAPPSGSFAGMEASRARLVLKSQQEIGVAGGMRYTLPAGTYRASFQDEAGLYFEAPSRLIYHEKLFGLELPAKPREGGLYLKREEPTRAIIYFLLPNEGGELQRLYAGMPFPVKMRDDEKVDFTLQSAP